MSTVAIIKSIAKAGISLAPLVSILPASTKYVPNPRTMPTSWILTLFSWNDVPKCRSLSGLCACHSCLTRCQEYATFDVKKLGHESGQSVEIGVLRLVP